MTNETTDFTEEEVNQAKKKHLEQALKDALHHYFVEVRKIDPEAKMYDPEGNAAFVVVAFNNVRDDELLMEGQEEQTRPLSATDRACAISSSSIAVMPEVIPNEHGQIGAAETVKHGVQCVASGMLLSSLQNQAIYQSMVMAQQTITKARKMQ